MFEQVLSLLFGGEDLWVAVDEECILDAFLFGPFSFDGLGILLLLVAFFGGPDRFFW